MKAYNNKYTNQVCDILKPLFGEMMAGGIIKSQASKLGLNEDELSLEQLPALADFIEKGLIVFVGKETAQQISTKIKQIK